MGAVGTNECDEDRTERSEQEADVLESVWHREEPWATTAFDDVY